MSTTDRKRRKRKKQPKPESVITVPATKNKARVDWLDVVVPIALSAGCLLIIWVFYLAGRNEGRAQTRAELGRGVPEELRISTGMLSKWFLEYDLKYFKDKLPLIPISYDFDACEAGGYAAFFDPSNPRIVFNPRYADSEKLLREFLLHEMAHESVHMHSSKQLYFRFNSGQVRAISQEALDPHGKEWQKEMHRLMRLHALDDLL